MKLSPTIRRRVLAQLGENDRQVEHAGNSTAAPIATPGSEPRSRSRRVYVPAALATPALAIELTIPIQTVSDANAREGHWSGRHRRTRKADEALATVLALYGLAGVRPPLPLMVTLIRLGGRPLDGDNLQSSLKHIRDSVAEWLGVDDGTPDVEWRYDGLHGGNVGVRVRVQTRRRGPRSERDRE